MTAHAPFALAALVGCLAAATDAAAQAPLQLGALQREAQAADARTREFDALARQSELRLRNLDVEQLPSVSVIGQTQVQSDVPTVPFALPSGAPSFAPPKFTYDASLRVDQRIYDPSLNPRRALERAGLAESTARVRTSLYALRQEVNDAFFNAALLQEEIGALDASVADLEARLHETDARVREGVALAGESAAVEAALLRQRQQRDELTASRGAALARLSRLTGRTFAADTPLTIPDLAAATVNARRDLDAVRARPEYAQFATARDRAAKQQDLASAAERPQVSAFGRVGYGRPGLNFISDQREPYALAGLQLQWKAWTWSASDRDREVQALQQDIVRAEEASFTDAIRRGVENDLATIDRLQRTAADDDRIVALRDAIDRSARSRFNEGVTTAADYVDRRTEWLTAQFDRARHRVELAYAEARLLTMLGLEVQ